MRSNDSWYLVRSGYMTLCTDWGPGLLDAALSMVKHKGSIGDGVLEVNVRHGNTILCFSKDSCLARSHGLYLPRSVPRASENAPFD